MHTSTYWPSRSHSCQTEAAAVAAAAALSGLTAAASEKRKEGKSHANSIRMHLHTRRADWQP